MLANRDCFRALAAVSASVMLAGCGDSAVTPPTYTRSGISVVAGGGVIDTVDSKPDQALVVEVKMASGAVASKTAIRFEAQPPADSARRAEAAIYVCPLAANACGAGTRSTVISDTTNASGRASVLFRLGTVAGRAVIRVTAPELGLVDSVVFTVKPGNISRLHDPADTAVDIGKSTVLRGRVVDRYDNARPELPTVTAQAGSKFSFDATTGTVTGAEFGSQYLYYRFANFVDSTSVRVLPPGRIVVLSPFTGSIRLVDLNGSNLRTLATHLSSEFGAFPRYSASRGQVTLQANPLGFGSPTLAVVLDTTGAPRRDIGPTVAFTVVVATRLLSNGTLVVVARREGDVPSFSVYRVTPDNTVTLVAPLAGYGAYGSNFGGVDISHDGTRIVYLDGGNAGTTIIRILNTVSGTNTLLTDNGLAPRWSTRDDRVAILVPRPDAGVGTLSVINADGTGLRDLGPLFYSEGVTWSPDDNYILGRSSVIPYGVLRLVRVTDGANVTLRLPNGQGGSDDYFQPDWR